MLRDHRGKMLLHSRKAFEIMVSREETKLECLLCKAGPQCVGN